MKPKEIILEVTNHCNLRCRFCHIHSSDSSFKRKQGMMSRGIWEKVLAEIATWPGNVSLVTHGAGEPLLYPHIKELLVAAKGLRNVTVGFMTNGMLLNEDMASFVVDNEIDWIALSIDGVNPETHDRIRKNSNLLRIEKNVNRLIKTKKIKGALKPQLNFNMVMYPEIKEQQEEYLSKWLPHAQSVTLSRFRPLSSKRLFRNGKPLSFRPCALLYSQAVVSWTGKMALCCEDIEVEVSPGDVNLKGLEDIFSTSTTYKLYREAHERSDIKRLALCKDCDVWAAHKVLSEERGAYGDTRVIMRKTPAAVIYETVSA